MHRRTQFTLLVWRWENVDSGKEAVLSLGEVVVLYEVLCKTNAVDGPILDSILFSLKLTFHGTRAVGDSLFVSLELCVHLSNVKQCERVVALKRSLIKSPVDVKRESFFLGRFLI